MWHGVYKSHHQALAVDHAFKICEEENVKLLIIDSVLSHFRSDNIGRETLAKCQQTLNSHLHKLTRLAQALNLAVVVTNQIQANPQAFFGDPIRPAGGNILAASQHRTILKKASGGSRSARVIDSPYRNRRRSCRQPRKESKPPHAKNYRILDNLALPSVRTLQGQPVEKVKAASLS